MSVPIYRPMDPLNAVEIEKETRNIIESLIKAEEKNTTSFRNWPKIERTPYELEPKRRNSGLD